MKPTSIIFALLLIAMIASCSKSPNPETVSNYPVSAKVDTVDTYFGVKVPDPYRWMENDTTKQVADWVTAQNEVTFGFLG
jgi:prolyl oligopeptidase